MATRMLGSCKATTPILITSVDLAADVGATVLPVANGGNGTGTFTDGQILIGQTTGNTLAKKSLSGAATMDKDGVVTLSVVPSSKGGFGVDVSGYTGIAILTAGVTSNLTNTRGSGTDLEIKMASNKWLKFTTPTAY